MTDDGAPGRLWRWLLFAGDRRAVAAALLAAFAVAFGPLGHLLTSDGSVPDATVVPLLTTLLSGNFLLVSIVVSVTSVYVSGEQHPLGQQFGRVRDTTEFRRQLETVVEVDHVPTDPEAFLRVLTGDLVERVQRLESEIPPADVDTRADLTAYLESLGDAVGEMNARLRGVSRPVAVVTATMGFDYARQVDDLQRMRAAHADALPDAARDTLDDTLDLLDYFAVAREYFKTLYLRREFASLSANLVYVSVPAIGAVSFVILHLSRLPDSHAFLVALHVLSLAPFAVLVSHALRVAAVSRRTDSPGQFAFDGDGGVPGVGED